MGGGWSPVTFSNVSIFHLENLVGIQLVKCLSDIGEIVLPLAGQLLDMSKFLFQFRDLFLQVLVLNGDAVGLLDTVLVVAALPSICPGDTSIALPLLAPLVLVKRRAVVFRLYELMVALGGNLEFCSLDEF